MQVRILPRQLDLMGGEAIMFETLRSWLKYLWCEELSIDRYPIEPIGNASDIFEMPGIHR